MNFRDRLKLKHPKPVCVGTGLIVLDIVINGKPKSSPRFWAGGSCGNVLTILSYLGWESYPIARLGNDRAAGKLLRDMKKWRVKTRLISLNRSDSTPIIIEKLGTSPSGTPWHRFEWTCPNCGSWLPRYKPVLARDVEKISKKIPESQVFYFDRVSRSSIELAKVSKVKGALLFFEPSAVEDKKLFSECLKVSDIVKYSHERFGYAQKLTQEISVPLEIETLGAGGLRYRCGGNHKRNRKWQNMRAYPVKNLKDAAGAGDWCSAGIIHILGSAGRERFEKAARKDIETALSFGQTFAALNCYYEGARGSMYNLSRRKFERLVHSIRNNTNSSESIEEKETNRISGVFRNVCPSCVNGAQTSDYLS